ncbi:MAG: energy-coupling factor transporter transmembrane protein EcfT [Corallococcus sp.]|nr:energy-coupling factor transporter transmembrane protein EcfT [Corallococcus sp.]
MFRDVTFGQYYPAESFVHKMDARVKILINILFMVGIFFVTSYVGFAWITLFLAFAIGFSKVPFKSILKSLKGILFLLLFTAVLNIFITKGEPENLLCEWWIFAIYKEGLFSASKLMLRLAYLICGASLLTLTTTPVDLTHAIESLLKPLTWIKIPVHVIALIMSLALSLIPSLIEETDRIIRAQKARGADFDTGGLIKRAKAFIPILIPLLVSSFRRADELAFAMNSRCYQGSNKRTQLRLMKFGWRDLVACIVTAVFFGAVFTLFAMSESWSVALPWLYL